MPFALLFFPGCEFIGDVFKAGIWVGIVIIIAIIAVILFIVKMFKN
jgi:di/tricarboxylate transporter